MIRQAKAFLGAFHSSRIAQSAKLVEEETWSQADVPAGPQRNVDLIVDCAVRDAPEMVVIASATAAVPPAVPDPNGTSAIDKNGIEGNAADVEPMTNGTHTAAVVNGIATAAAKNLHIEERTYFVVSATLEVLAQVVEYLKVVVNLSLLTTEAVGKVIEFLKAFNSRTCQVVLGAGAMRSAGLKNITAKHLALASQSLSIMVALIPYIRETFRRHLNPKQAVMLVEFDKLKRDYQEHQNEIHAKLIAIMGDRLSVHCKGLQEVDWEAVPPKSGPNGYMEVLVKETVTLHKVLSKYLPPQIVELIMTQVFAAINHRLSEEFGVIGLQSQEGKNRLLEDVRFLHERLSGLKNVGGISGMLETVVQEKSIPRRSLAERMTSFTSGSSQVTESPGESTSE